MSKAILVIDMPEKCIECPCCNIGAFYDICKVLNKTTPCADNGKPGWCPLRELPQKKSEATTTTSDYFKVIGYNACIDKIMKGSEENG